MKIFIAIALFASLACIFAEDMPGFEIPASLKTEADALKTKIDNLNLPKTPDGKYPDICKITDATIKAEVFAFIDKVNAAGGKMPKPPCA